MASPGKFHSLVLDLQKPLLDMPDESCLKREKNCDVCQKLADFVLKRTAVYGNCNLGSWQGFLDRKHCRCCQTIVRHLSPITPAFKSFEPSCVLTLDVRNSFYVICHGGNRHSTPYLSLLDVDNRGTDRIHYVGAADSAEVDITKIITWSADCEQNHKGSCHDLPPWQTIHPPISMFLIDVQQNCLVQAHEGEKYKYVALSYVWGRIPESLELTRQNLSLLFVPGALARNSHGLLIPRTIWDAMTLCRGTGLRYLWVDRLCIVQDMPTHLTEQIQQMASIYGNSHFTIIAADGFDAHCGLRGVDHELADGIKIDALFEFSEAVKMVQKPETEPAWFKPFWSTRGWTFQERAVSPRNLVFVNNRLYWECRAATRFDNVVEASLFSPHDHVVQPSKWPSYALKVNPWPDLDQYSKLVEGYNSRKLTYEGDALNAFAACIAALSRSFPSGFHFALPSFLFDIAMLWSPYRPPKRRNAFPSWSWLGWAGSVNIPWSYTAAWTPDLHPTYHSHFDVRIQPLVDWYAIHRTDNSRHLIDNSYYRYAVDISDVAFTASDGWRKIWSMSHNRFVVQHDHLLDMSFKHPFPVLPPARLDNTSSFSNFLNFDAKACTLSLAGSPSHRKHKFEFIYDLWDNEGRWSGVIRSMDMTEDQCRLGVPCTLIAISAGEATQNDSDYTTQPFEEMESVPEIKLLKQYEFYNVLWIEQVGDIAYRKAIGRVWKAAWDLQDVQSVNVTLG